MKILVVDDHALVRAGLSQVLLGLYPDESTEVLEASDCTRAFAIADAHPDLDLVLLDYHLPDMDGLAALIKLGKTHPELPVVILSGSANPSIAKQVLAQGAAGFITKSGLSDELLSALRLVLAGEIYSHPGFETSFATHSAAADLAPPLFTSRQQEVLQLLLVGATNRDIGEELGLSDETVKTHVTHVMRGFGVKTRIQAALQARRWGYDKSTPQAS